MLSTFFVSIGLAEPFFQIRIFWIWSLLAFVTLMVYTVLAAWLSAAISYWCVPLAPVVCVLTALLPTKMFLVVSRIQQASAKLRNVFVKALLWC